MSLIEIPKSNPLESAPLQGEILDVDLVDGSCTVDVAGAVLDSVTWFGQPPPKVGDLVQLIDTGDRLIISSVGVTAADVVLNTSAGSETDKAMSVSAAKAYSNGRVINSMSPGTITDQAPSQNAVNTALSGKAASVHTHDDRYYTEAEVNALLASRPAFKFGRPSTAFPIGADTTTGDITIAHGLGRLPVAVFVSADDDGGDCTVFASVQSFDATNIVAHMRNVGAAESHVYINWIAF